MPDEKKKKKTIKTGYKPGNVQKSLNDLPNLLEMGVDEIPKMSPATEFNHEPQLGIKFDFLGLEALTIIEDTLGIIGATESAKLEEEVRGVLDVEKDIYSNRKIYEQMKLGNSYEIFQFSSDSIKSLTTQILPDNMDSIPDDKVKDMFYDLVAATALGRPGADSDLYIENKNNPENIEYLFPELENILSETYGVPVYQEQIMEMVQEVGGFSLGEADLMRRAMGKNMASEMVAMEGKFVQGAVDKHPDEDALTVENNAKKLWAFILPFAEYGFNKSHAVTTTQVSMQQAYLKFNYPEQYFTSLLRNKSGDKEKLTEIIVDAKKNGVVLESEKIAEQADSWSKQAPIEKDRFSIKDIDTKKTNLKNFETEQIQSDWKNMESNANNGEYVLIQKGYREIETKAGKPIYIFELTDGVSGRVMEFVHFNPLNNSLLDANNGFPIKIKLGKYNPAYGMSSAFNAQPTPLGISALTDKAMERESGFIEDGFILDELKSQIKPSIPSFKPKFPSR